MKALSQWIAKRKAARALRLNKPQNRLSRVKRQNSWRRHALVSATSMLLCVSTLMLMTGVLYFSNDNTESPLFKVDITADGQTFAIETATITTEELLQLAGVVLDKYDTVSKELDQNVAEGDEIIVRRVEFREKIQIDIVPYETTVQYSNLIAIGDEDVSEGIDGEVTIVRREKLIDGKVVSSSVLSREQTIDPVAEIITRGRALQTPYSKRDFPEIQLENGLPVDYIQVITGSATAYTARPTSGTASGRKLQIGTVAVNPKIIPYGSLLYIVTSCGSRVYGAAVAACTGTFIHDTHRFVAVDLYMGLTSENYREALRWGQREVNVYVINTGVY